MSNSHTAERGIVLMLDALGARDFNIDQSISFIDFRDSVLEKHGKYTFGPRNNQSKKKEAGDNYLPPQNIITFGDTIIYTWNLGGNVKLGLTFTALFSSVLIVEALRAGYLLRGSLSIGEYIVDKGSATVLGPAISEAAQWYESAQFVGIVLAPSAFVMLEAVSRSENRDIVWPFYTKYDVPVRDGIMKSSWVVSWPFNLLYDYWHGNVGDPYLDLCKYLHPLPFPKGTENKLLNTLSFFNWYANMFKDQALKAKEKHKHMLMKL